MKRGNKKGLSAVITTLLIILLVMVAVGVVWGVISNIVNEGSKQIGTGAFTIDLEIQKVVLKEGAIDVKIKRNKGQGELAKIKFIISNGEESQTFEKETSMQELGEQIFTIEYTGIVKDVSIAPILGSESGEVQANTKDTFTYNAQKDFENIQGLISWWRFEENTNDEQNLNDATAVDANPGNADGNTPPQYVNGKFGQALDFDGTDDYVAQTSQQNIPEGSASVTYSAWVYVQNTLTTHIHAMLIGWEWADETGLALSNNDEIEFGMYGTNGVPYQFTHTEILEHGKWYHVAASYETTTNNINVYINGNKQSFTSTVAPRTQTYNIIMGAANPGFHYHDIQLDEVMIFNKALTPE